MSISAVSGNDPYGLQSLLSQPKQDLQSLASDLGSGNLAGAQKDFASLQKDVSSAFQALTQSTTSPLNLGNMSTAGGGTTADLQALQSALGSNDLAGAQKSFAAFQQDVQSLGGSHRGHHRHHHVSSDDNDSQDPQSTAATGTGTGLSNPGNSVPNFTMAAMLAAYKAFGSGTTGATSTVSAVA